MPVALSSLLPILLLQIGPHPTFGDLPDHSGEVLDRPPRQPVIEDPAGLLESSDDGWLSACLSLVGTDPARAHVQAQLRREQTVGPEQVVAQYCLGMASAGLQRWDDAVAALIAARDGIGEAEPRLKARFGIMAANAAIAANDYISAHSLLAQARADAETDAYGFMAAIAAIDQARIFVLQGENDRAVTMLADARRLNPQSSDAWLLSATLMRRLERLGEARGMIEQAQQLDTANPEIALEAGVIAVLEGRDETARDNWNTVITLAPGSPQAETARGYLAQLGEAVPTP